MPPRLRGRGLADLGRALDERKSQPTKRLVIQHNINALITAPLAGSGLGGSGAASAPVYSVPAEAAVLHYPANMLVPRPEEVTAPDGAVAERTWHTQAWPLGAAFAPVSATPQLSVNLAQSSLGTCCASLAWISQPDGVDGILTGSAVGLGLAFAKAAHAGGAASGRVIVRARLYVNSPQRFSSIRLVLNDVGETDATPANYASADVLPLLTAGQWAEVALVAEGTDIHSWGNQLRAGLIACGTEVAGCAGETELSLEWLRAELWRE
jgi:hypothetical protein